MVLPALRGLALGTVIRPTIVEAASVCCGAAMYFFGYRWQRPNCVAFIGLYVGRWFGGLLPFVATRLGIYWLYLYWARSNPYRLSQSKIWARADAACYCVFRPTISRLSHTHRSTKLSAPLLYCLGLCCRRRALYRRWHLAYRNGEADMHAVTHPYRLRSNRTKKTAANNTKIKTYSRLTLKSTLPLAAAWFMVLTVSSNLFFSSNFSAIIFSAW